MSRYREIKKEIKAIRSKINDLKDSQPKDNVAFFGDFSLFLDESYIRVENNSNGDQIRLTEEEAILLKNLLKVYLEV